jgi:phenylpropionate dioxygenase-like ring-hydroxylating dioxygenase large terminal subunit/AcrR family transcriptional regulator
MASVALDKKDARRRDLIEATISAIARNGFARTTLADVANDANLSRGIVSFYFQSKDDLFLETLRYLAEEYAALVREAVEAAGSDPAARIIALIDADLDPRVWNLDRIAAWVGFLAESKSHPDYREICRQYDVALDEELSGQIATLVMRSGRPESDAVVISRCLSALQQGFWYDLLFYGEAYDHAFVRAALIEYLATVMPESFASYRLKPETRPSLSVLTSGRNGEATEVINLTALPGEAPPQVPDVDSPFAGSIKTLPAWTYRNDEFYQLEIEHIFDAHWQLVCHVNDVKHAGDYATLDLASRRIAVIRDKKGEVRAFHNVCRHRAARLCPGKHGNHRFNIVCPYHGWSYNFDGTLRAMSESHTFPDLDMDKFGMWGIETEVWNGFVFVRLKNDGGPTVEEIMAPYAEELAPYRFAEMEPTGPIWTGPVQNTDWKNTMDNYLEGYHINPGHPGLYRMFGSNYVTEANEHGTGRAFSELRDEPSSVWSEGLYMKLLPRFDHLPEDRQRAWVYYSLFPNMAFDVYPDQISVFHVMPIAPGRSQVVGGAYALPDSRPEVKACRWLSNRINHQVWLEDNDLTDLVQEGLGSGPYTTGYFSEKEVCLARFHENVRARLPVATLDRVPHEGNVADVNNQLARRLAAAAE